jgi:hypothetical protein
MIDPSYLGDYRFNMQHCKWINNILTSILVLGGKKIAKLLEIVF